MLTFARLTGRLAGPAVMGLALVMSGCATTETPAVTATGAASSGAVSPELIAAGDALFHSSSCLVCHGEDAKGTAVGPNLTDATWLNGDGSVASITTIISEGVDAPKQFRSPMPAMGGANLSDADLKALSAYVWSLSHP